MEVCFYTDRPQGIKKAVLGENGNNEGRQAHCECAFSYKV